MNSSKSSELEGLLMVPLCCCFIFSILDDLGVTAGDGDMFGDDDLRVYL